MAFTPATVEDFKFRFPELSEAYNADDELVTVPDERIQLYLNDAVLLMGTDVTFWSRGHNPQGVYNQAQCYLAAHYITMHYKLVRGYGDVTPKILMNISADGVSQSWGGVNYVPRNPSEDKLMMTQYGYDYLMVKQNRPRPLMFIL